MPQRVLVTGATGLLGNNVARALLSAGAAVRLLVREGSDPRPREGLDVELAWGDIRDAESVAPACRDMDAVIHAAAYVHVGATGWKPAREINVEGADRVARAALEHGCRMVHVSSVDALGLREDGQPADEETPPGGLTHCPYVVTKREAEERILQRVGEGLDAVIVNPTYMLGPWDWKPSSGRMLIQVAIRWTPLAPPGGNNFCDVRDVAAGILSALERGETGRRYILGGENLSYVEAWRLFARVAGGKGPKGKLGPAAPWVAGKLGSLWGRLTGREGDVNSVAVAMARLPHYFTSERAVKELGYAPRPLEETVADAWAWFCENGYVKRKKKA